MHMHGHAMHRHAWPWDKNAHHASSHHLAGLSDVGGELKAAGYTSKQRQEVHSSRHREGHALHSTAAIMRPY